MRQPRPVGRHAVAALDGPDRDGVLVGALVAHDANALHRQQHRKTLPELRIPSAALHFLRNDGVGAAQQRQPGGCDVPQNPNREPWSRERLAHHKLFIEVHLAADLPHLVLEELAERFDELHAHPRRQTADVVVALDHRRLPDDGNRFDDVRIQRALSQEIDLAELCRLRLEHVDERRTDDLPLLLRIGYPGEPFEKELRGVSEHQRQLQPLVAFANLRGLVEPQHAVVDENTRQLIADRAMKDQGGDSGIDAAAERAHDTAASDLRADPRRRLLDERRHRPVAGAAADPVGEVPQNLEAAFRVNDFRVKQNRVQQPRRIRHRGHRRVRARRHHLEPVGGRRDEIAVTRPHPDFVRDIDEQRGGIARLRAAGATAGNAPRCDVAASVRSGRHLHDRVAVLAMRRRIDAAAEVLRHQLHAVADPEDRTADVVHAGIAFGRAELGHALWPAR